MNDEQFFKLIPKAELHAHLNGSISPLTMKKLLKLHKKLFPDEAMPHDSDTIIEKGSLGTIDDPFRMFSLIHKVTDNVEAVKVATHDVIREFAEDGVKYLELRSTPRSVAGRMTKRQYCDTVIDEIIKAENDQLDIRVKLLLAIDRRQVDSCRETVQLFLDLRELHPAVMAGIDLSGDPRVGDAVALIPELRRARELGIRLALHVGEVYNHEETMEFLKLKPDRLGHGTCIHPSLGGDENLWTQIISEPVPVEVCITSNVCCQTVPSVSQHQAGLLYEAGVPIVLCTDDKGVFLCSLSGEYKLAADTYNWGRDVMWKLAIGALEHAFCDSGERNILKKRWEDWRKANNGMFS